MVEQKGTWAPEKQGDKEQATVEYETTPALEGTAVLFPLHEIHKSNTTVRRINKRKRQQCQQLSTQCTVGTVLDPSFRGTTTHFPRVPLRDTRHRAVVAHVMQRIGRDKSVVSESPYRRLHVERVSTRQTHKLRVTRYPVIRGTLGSS